MKLITDKTKNILFAYMLVFVPMWVIFGLTNYMQIPFNFLGIHPRDFGWSEFAAIMGSWLVHANEVHIINNSIGLVGLLFFVALFEKQLFKLFFFLILTSGISTWILGAPNTVHIGASGLLFALFGYILGSAFTGRRWIYLIPIVAAFMYYGFAYYQSFLNGLMIKEEVSFAAHFGGLLSGVLVGVYFEKEEEKQFVYKKTLRQKWDNFKWSVNYRIKSFKR